MKPTTGYQRQILLVGSAFVLLLSAWIQSRVLAGTEVITPIRADAAHYVSYAWNLREFGTFSRARTWQAANPSEPKPDKLTLPGYPLFLSLFLDGKPDWSFVARVTTAQTLLGVATCGLVLLIALRVLTVPWALTAGVLTATSPHLATINTYLLTEGLFCFLTALFVYALVRGSQDPDGLFWWVFGAVSLAVASHVRPQLQLLPAIMLLVVVAHPGARRHWRKAVISVLIFCTLMAPWQLRNAHVDRPPGEPSLAANSLYHGGYPDFMYEGDPHSFGIPYRYDPHAADHGQSVGHSVQWIVSEFERNPGGMTRWYLVGKPAYFLSWNIVSGMGDVFIYPVSRSPYLGGGVLAGIRAISHALHNPLMILGFFAMLIGTIRPNWLRPPATAVVPFQVLSILVAVVVLMHMIGAPFPRYGIPFRWMLYLLAMFPLARLGTLIARWRAPEPKPAKL